MNFTTLLEMINASEAREDDPEFQSPVDLMLSGWNRKTRTICCPAVQKVSAVGRQDPFFHPDKLRCPFSPV